MKASILIAKLKGIDVPFDAELADSEFGPFMQKLIDIRHGAPFIVLVFGEGEGIKTSEAISRLEGLSSEVPFDPTVTNARLGDNHKELIAVRHDPPVTILEFEDD